MSAQGHATPGDAAASHDHDYEGIPADRPGPDEPRTPLWLPLVGMGLVLSALLAYLMTRPAGKTAAELAREAAPEASVAAAAPPGAAASAMPQRVRRLPGLASAFQPPATGSAPRAMGNNAPPPGEPPGSPTVNPPHGAPGHVH